MRFLFYTHSLVSDWNHGNAHFLRGVMRDLLRRGHDARALEPAGRVEPDEPAGRAGPGAVAAFRSRFPDLVSETIRAGFDHEAALDAADVVVVHEWTDPALVAPSGAPGPQAAACASLPRHASPRGQREGEIRALDLTAYDAVLAFGEALRERYLAAGWGRQVFTWHEAADTTVFRPLPADPARATSSGSATGATGSGRRSCGSSSSARSRAWPQRDRPRRALPRYARAGCSPKRGSPIAAGSPMPRCPARLRAPPRHRPCPAPALRRGAARHPHDPAVRGAGLRHPARQRALGGCEGLFRPGDYLTARDGAEMRASSTCSRDPRRGPKSRRAGWRRSAPATPAATGRTSFWRARRPRPRRAVPGERLMNRIAFYGSSLLSPTGTAPRPTTAASSGRSRAEGYEITFYEPDVHDRQAHRDIDPPDWCEVVVWEGSVKAAAAAARAAEADIVVKASGVGYEDDRFAEVMAAARPGALRVFWDVDAPATLAELSGRAGPSAAARCCPRSTRPDLWRRRSGGAGLPRARRARLAPIYNALDPRRTISRPARRRASRPISPSSATACPTARRGCGSSSSAPPRRCPTGASCSAARAGTTSRCPRTSAQARPCADARAQRLQRDAPDGAERRARQHGGHRLLARHPRVRGGRRRRLPRHRRLGGDRAVPRARARGAGGPRRGQDVPAPRPA
jgi:spore maturation protein CgeB